MLGALGIYPKIFCQIMMHEEQNSNLLFFCACMYEPISLINSLGIGVITSPALLLCIIVAERGEDDASSCVASESQSQE